jgi:hypothetical protein
MLTQLAEWTRLCFLTKTGQGRYARCGRPVGGDQRAVGERPCPGADRACADGNIRDRPYSR